MNKFNNERINKQKLIWISFQFFYFLNWILYFLLNLINLKVKYFNKVRFIQIKKKKLNWIGDKQIWNSTLLNSKNSNSKFKKIKK